MAGDWDRQANKQQMVLIQRRKFCLLGATTPPADLRSLPNNLKETSFDGDQAQGTCCLC